MNSKVIHKTTVLPFEGKSCFGEAVMKLIEIGAERYHADLTAQQKNFYGKDGGIHIEKLSLKNAPAVAGEFDAEAVRATIKMAQQGKIYYPELLSHAMKAGTCSYGVHIDGKQVIYFGRKGDFYVEEFPQPK